MIYSAKNTRFNREAGIVDQKIMLLEKKHGLAYFVILADKNIFCECEDSLFDNAFSPETDQDILGADKKLELTAGNIAKLNFKRYPTGLKK